MSHSTILLRYVSDYRAAPISNSNVYPHANVPVYAHPGVINPTSSSSAARRQSSSSKTSAPLTQEALTQMSMASQATNINSQASTADSAFGLSGLSFSGLSQDVGYDEHHINGASQDYEPMSQAPDESSQKL